MRLAIVAVLMAVSGLAQAQDGAHMMTLAEVKQRRAELAGLFVRVENVTISGFAMSRGGLASDASTGVHLDDGGMPMDTITYLERNCAKAGAAAAPAGCRGALEFTVAQARGNFTISDAQFIPQR
ncbi:MAG TPA: hypothetical protein VGN82_24085 [Bosea sp. (in: a-proteobacteria)]|jgi:hypothetical protein|uniref:hypothetical protein n=1 Tax=Bosea sp. (in: a-proteobacteria) TaxID=1871050 RepID=UPI002E0F236E|nr:hypothetical protein [Bosea sp. (in: a-proteobacteria)]